MTPTPDSPESPSPPFGALLRRLRGAASLSQEELAARAGVAVRTISDLERGVARRPQPATLALLSRALGLDADPAAREALEASAHHRSPVAADDAAGGAPSFRSGLPGYLTDLIGRERDEAAVAHLLRQEGVRLLTLTGPGGVGKTRLAAQAAAGLADAFPDGVLFVPLAALDDPALVLPAVAHAVGVRPDGDVPVAEALATALGGKRLLVVLDNMEQVADAAPGVAALLARCSGVRALVTSRAALRVGGEQLYPVPPLALPDPARAATPGEVASSPAVALFVARARAVRPAFALDDANAAEVAEICRRLDGLPLALELAAARIPVLPPAALLARLGRSLDVLTGGARDLPARQQTMRATIAWSHDLLDAGQQVLFRRLAVFTGGCTVEAVEAVRPDTDEGDGKGAAERVGDILDGIGALVDSSLLRLREGADGEPRYAMLETIREYAAARLAASGEEEAARRAHAAFYLALAEAAEPALTGPEQVIWLRRLDAEHDNLRAALRWAHRRGDVEIGLRIAGALWRFWLVRGYLREGREWLDDLLALAGSDPGVDLAARARACNGAGCLASYQGDWGQAGALYEESLALRRALGDKRGIASSLNNLGLVVRYRGEYRRAVALYEESLALLRERRDTWGTAAVLHNLGEAAWEQGAYEQAAALFEESLALRRESRDTEGMAESLAALGLLRCHQGAHEQAASLLAESLAMAQELQHNDGLVNALNALGLVARYQGDMEQAAVLLAESVRVAREMGHAWAIARGLCNLADVTRDRRDDGRAAALYGSSLGIFRDIGSRIGIASCLEGLAQLASLQGQPARTTRLYAAAKALRNTMGTPLVPADRASYDRTREAMRATLGNEAFAAAWAAGEAMTLKQALAEALAGTA